ncbi:MAG: chitobiase/beta-hexosaminidase C-terminal domain-containing protein [Flavobacterium sp.]|uniref:chitobiase/beta-hexosaminidase C-terminal domain-containing protein n=1 Tax=Flavobacterium sp. TaxID=239 RepID=UPI0022BE4F3F|nr:chitobiase/beta-hexosaminidase C-terminal domain-containing protein [Flavobacterium sp.]MCZ8168186.1 chitobiase/beta-hexosaminidase C-terminal domain-containing protein [Flavobacterium sp.]MCZ8297259.1 chitobiase/beta-hexosaminidase C-terminal domain-containing protein [Flavobacterium sp.]
MFFPQPTPGTSNGAVVGYAEVLAPPTFSVQGGFFTESFTLSLSHPDPAVTIVYTTDGSDPNINNLNGTTYFYKNVYPEEIGALPSTTFLSNSFQSQTYTAPLTIADRTNAPNDISMISSTFDDDPSLLFAKCSNLQRHCGARSCLQNRSISQSHSHRVLFCSPTRIGTLCIARHVSECR